MIRFKLIRQCAVKSLCILVGIGVFSTALAGPFTATKEKACPDAWSLTNKTIPVIYSTTEQNNSPWGVAPSSDKEDAQAHIIKKNPIVTTDGTSLTHLNFEDDLLTIASECLVYRNIEVDSAEYTEPAAVEINTATGWIPAAVY